MVLGFNQVLKFSGQNVGCRLGVGFAHAYCSTPEVLSLYSTGGEHWALSYTVTVASGRKRFDHPERSSRRLKLCLQLAQLFAYKHAEQQLKVHMNIATRSLNTCSLCTNNHACSSFLCFRPAPVLIREIWDTIQQCQQAVTTALRTFESTSHLKAELNLPVTPANALQQGSASPKLPIKPLQLGVQAERSRPA